MFATHAAAGYVDIPQIIHREAAGSREEESMYPVARGIDDLGDHPSRVNPEDVITAIARHDTNTKAKLTATRLS